MSRRCRCLIQLPSNAFKCQVDLSFSVRKAVRSLKELLKASCLQPKRQDEADELLRTLNPNYGMAQQALRVFRRPLRSLGIGVACLSVGAERHLRVLDHQAWGLK